MKLSFTTGIASSNSTSGSSISSKRSRSNDTDSRIKDAGTARTQTTLTMWKRSKPTKKPVSSASNKSAEQHAVPSLTSSLNYRRQDPTSIATTFNSPKRYGSEQDNPEYSQEPKRAVSEPLKLVECNSAPNTTTILDEDVLFSDYDEPEPDSSTEDSIDSINSTVAIDLLASAQSPSMLQSASYFTELQQSIQRSLSSEWAEIEAFLHTDYVPQELEEFNDLFEAFRRQETGFSGWNPAFLVTPSGHPGERLHLKLHYPTFRSQHLEYGESADDTNNSTKLLMRKGLDASNAFWFEACFRRQTPTSSRHQECATKLWPTEVKDTHSSFSHLCEGFRKKVLLLFGAVNRKNFNLRYAVVERTVRTSPTELVTVGIVRRPNEAIHYLVVYCPHPEWLLWNWTTWAGRYYDACINVAATLTGLEVLPHLFEQRASCVKVNATQKNALRDADTTRKLEKQNKVRCHPDDLPPNVQLFAANNGIPKDRLKTHFQGGWSVAQLVYEFIKARQPSTSSWNNGVRMPRNLPRNLPAQPTSGLSTRSSSSTSSALCIVPNVTKSKNPIIKTAVIHKGQEILLMCIRCGKTPHSKPVDRKPVFVTISAAAGKYIAQRQACATPACNPKGRKGQIDQFMVPQDPNIPFIRSDNLSKVAIPEDTKTG
ncbi:hypothetical protein N0V83_004341 [Neocucurbitaria cava]|uniref:Uncharacterized protein n=1 Tax=Neocucurbitaria cava TaxID=798079 RepID=A0A9W8YBR4_9PLEO|nr:hypothetical protein N0V83_004341 [Neocucurbitaria cava]